MRTRSTSGLIALATPKVDPNRTVSKRQLFEPFPLLPVLDRVRDRDAEGDHLRADAIEARTHEAGSLRATMRASASLRQPAARPALPRARAASRYACASASASASSYSPPQTRIRGRARDRSSLGDPLAIPAHLAYSGGLYSALGTARGPKATVEVSKLQPNFSPLASFLWRSRGRLQIGKGKPERAGFGRAVTEPTGQTTSEGTLLCTPRELAPVVRRYPNWSLGRT